MFSRKPPFALFLIAMLLMAGTATLLAQDDSTSIYLPLMVGQAPVDSEAANQIDVMESETQTLATDKDAVHSAATGLGVLPDPLQAQDFVDDGTPNAQAVELGHLLFFDKILSGNQNISCATCHHPLAATGDGLSLAVGEGARGLGVTRDTGSGEHTIGERVPRNSPPLFTLGLDDVTHLFHDGRVQQHPGYPSGFHSPAEYNLPGTLENILAVQAMFPVTSGTEMAGQSGENPIGAAGAAGQLTTVWELLADRLRANEEYVTLFNAAYGIGAGEITYAHAANAIAAFEVDAWRADNTPFDRYLRGEHKVLSVREKAGMQLFYGKAQCATCHSGSLLSDMDFHAIGVPQVGPGKGVGVGGNEDFGREHVTGDADDRYRFRTPPLRNVAMTGPWGHDGAFDTLEAMLRHHIDPAQSMTDYSCETQIRVPKHQDPDKNQLDCEIQSDSDAVTAIISANELEVPQLTEAQIGDLLDFMHALTDPDSLDLRDDVPLSVPSGLPLAD
jgi:cytochrome c peroxidase